MAAVVEYARPESVDGLLRFVSMCGYYRRFVEKYAEKEDALREMIKRCSGGVRKSTRLLDWEEDERAAEAFENMKEQLAGTTLLTHFDTNNNFVVRVDSSEKGWGAVLMQDEKVVEWASGSFNAMQRRYGPAEREALGVVMALEKWKRYLWGKRTTVVCDCRALAWLVRSKKTSGKLWRWAARLSEFDVEVVHAPSTQMRDVDALSRAPREEAVVDPTEEESTREEEKEMKASWLESVDEALGTTAVKTGSLEMKEQERKKRNKQVNQEKTRTRTSGARAEVEEQTSARRKKTKDVRQRTGQQKGARSEVEGESGEEKSAVVATADNGNNNNDEEEEEEEEEQEKRRELVRVAHESWWSGHPGVEGTKRLLVAAGAKWRGMGKQIKELVEKCRECARKAYCLC